MSKRKVLQWDTDCRDYDMNLRRCNILPLSLYLEVQFLFLEPKTLNENCYNCEIIDFICSRETEEAPKSTGYLEFQHGKPKTNCEQSFFYRTGNLINRLPNDMDSG